MEILGSFLQILLIIIVISIVLMKNNIKVIILLSSFSLITASLYFFNKAPDVALAEVAIGSAIMPLLYILAISKQREFIVLCYTNKECLQEEIIDLLTKFSDFYKLKLKYIHKTNHNDNNDIINNGNIDLILKKNEKDNYFFICRESSTLMNKLQQLTMDLPNVNVVKVENGEDYD